MTTELQSEFFLRSQNGELLDQVENFDHATVQGGEYVVEIPAPVKVYLRFSTDSEFDLRNSSGHQRISFGKRTTIQLGVRSLQEQPVATITTTEDPADMLRAISYFGSGLKSTSPERSYLTLRGHPPEVPLGTELEIPSELSIRPRTFGSKFL